MIEIKNVNKSFKNKKNIVYALKNVSLKVEKKDICGIIGYSGAGKSTLIRLVNALEKSDTGSVIVDKKDISKLKSKELNELRKNVGMIFQHFSLMESQTVYQNLEIPLIISKNKKEYRKKRIDELLEFVDLKDKKNIPISKLSGGQKQRIGIARALANQPKILLCDEATSALDPKTTKSILGLLKKINKEFGITILLITHEMEVIKEICNKVAVMENGEIKEFGNVIDIFSNPKEEITKDFISTIINHKIPENLLKELDKNLPIIKLTFLGKISGETLLSDINKKYNVSTKILSASVNELTNTILGILVIQLEGDEEEIKKVELHIKKRGVLIERVII